MNVNSRDDGVITAFVVGITLTLMVATGLAFDSGRLVATRIELADHAENAARLAAQEVTGIRSGNPRIDPLKGRRVASSYLANHGVEGTVEVGLRSVSVEVHGVQDMSILKLVGITSKSVSVTRSAEITDA